MLLFENEVVLGDCLEVLRKLSNDCLDSIVTDPPYGLGNREPTVEEIIRYLRGDTLDTGGDFMGAEWEIPSVEVWKECFRVLKPGGHVLSFGGTRTWDLISLGLRAAGFENRDTIAEDHPALQWKHGQGFPKSLNVFKTLEKMWVGSEAGRSQSSCEPSHSNVWCVCSTRQEADSSLDGSVGLHVGHGARYGVGSSYEAPSREVGGTVSAEAAGEVGGACVQDDPSRKAVVCELRQADSTQEERLGAEQEAVLQPPVCVSGSEDSGHGDVALWARVEESSVGDTPKRSNVPVLREDTPREQEGATRPSSQAVQVRGLEQRRESGGVVRFVPPHHRESDDSSFVIDPDQHHPRRIIADDSGRWGHPVARVCSWCGCLDREHYSRYEGLGTALKPSWEPILVFRKPVPGTIVENVLRHGTGGMNIDATRVRHSSPEDFEKHKAMVDRLKEQGGSLGNSWKNSSDLSGASEVRTEGRWPPNSVMTHAEGCQKVGTKKVTEEIEAWNCVPGCPIRALDEQTGTLTSGAVEPHHMRNNSSQPSDGGFNGQFGDVPLSGYGDSGGASRFFPQFETDQSSGRWPPNSVMTHAKGCKKVGTKRFKGSATSKTFHEAYEGESSTQFLRGVSHPGNQHADEDGLETSDSWQCVEGCPVRALDEQTGVTGSGRGEPKVSSGSKSGNSEWTHRGGSYREGQTNVGVRDFGDSGGASRFFPQFEGQTPPEASFLYTGKATKREATLDGQVPNKHPTKKPLALMKWLVQLVTPKGGVVLDLYCGSGTTCVAAVDLGMRFIGIEKDPSFHADTVKRVGLVLQKAQEEHGQRDVFSMIMGDDFI